MRSYALAGRRAEALRQYRTCVRILEGELGVPPAPETTALHDNIRSGQVGPPAVGPLPSDALMEELPSHNLPAQPNPFIGREAELAGLLVLVRDPAVRLVTVVGAGGMGKTRLALQAATDLLEDFPEGVWLAELARVSEADAVTDAVARALGVQPQPDRDLADTIVDALGTRQLLLVLDNCEHVLEGVAPLLDKLLAHCPQLTLLATSREALHIPGERLHDLPPMHVPGPEDQLDQLPAADAVRLFVERGKDVRSEFVLVDENAGEIADICRRLDGMPLAIELAAARLRLLSPAEIASRLGDRFGLLTGGARTLQPRQRTLYSTVTWSYELLDEAERTLFNRLSVFRGGFTLQAAEAVGSGDGVGADDVLDLLASLVDKSLVVASQNDGGATRYTLLETLRQYGAERLEERGDTEAVCLRHALYYLELAEEIGALLDLWEDWPGLFQRLDPETDNIASAMRWSLAHDRADIALRLGGALKWWALTRPHHGQSITWLTRALEGSADAAPRDRAKALHALNLYRWFYVLYDEDASRLAALGLEASEEAGDPELVAEALLNVAQAHGVRVTPLAQAIRFVLPKRLQHVGRAAGWSGEREREKAMYEQSLDIARGIHSPPHIVVRASASLARFMELAEGLEALKTLLAQTPHSGRLFVLQHLVGCSFETGNLVQAERHNQEAFEAAGEWGSESYQAAHLYLVGLFSILQGDYERAERALVRCAQLARPCGTMSLLVVASQMLGETAWFQGDVGVAESRWNEALELAEQYGAATDVAGVRRWLSHAVCARGEFDRAETLCRQSMEAYPEGDVVSRTHVMLPLARIALFRGEPTRAKQLFQASVRDSRSWNWGSRIRAFEGLVWAYGALGCHDEAARLLGFLAAERERTGMLLPPVDQPHHDRALKSAREALDPQAFATAWEDGGTLTLEEAVTEATA
jgi:predicted ATPase